MDYQVLNDTFAWTISVNHAQATDCPWHVGLSGQSKSMSIFVSLFLGGDTIDDDVNHGLTRFGRRGNRLLVFLVLHGSSACDPRIDKIETSKSRQPADRLDQRKRPAFWRWAL